MLYGALGRTNPCTRRSAGLVALALTAVLGRAHGQSEVSGCEFTHGDGRVERFGNGFLIFAEGGRVIMQCDRFNVGPGNGVEFRQDGATARLLNRINGDFGPSDINGSLTANGIIFIVNPAGVFFGNGALVNVGGIYAASGNITDSDFLADTYRFDTSAGDMVRVDPGANIAATQMVHLIGQQVANHGDISVGTGTVALLAANDEVIITEMGERISVQVDGVNLDRGLERPGTEDPVLTGEAGVENTGSIEVTSGQVVLGASDMYALAIRNTGDILVGGNDGAAQLTALAGTVLHEGSIRAADVAMTGGVIFLDDDVQADEALFNDAVVLGSDITIEGTDGSATNVEFVSTVDSEEDEENGLTVDSADTRFGDAVGGGDVLGDLDVSGRAQIDGGAITTTGLQRYRGAVTLGDDTTLAAGDEFATGVQFDDTVSSTANDAHTLALEAATTFGGAVGSGTDQELGSLNVDGLARIDGGSVETTGLQRYGGAVTLGQNTTLTTQNGDASVEFVSTVDSEEGQDSTLTVDSAETTFGDEVGEIEELGSLEVTGVANIDGGRITTTGLQRYRGAVTLGDDTTLAAGDEFATGVQFDDTVSSTANDAHTLAMEAATTFGGAVGAGADQELGSLNVDGLARIDGGSVETTGLQRYGGAVTLGQNTTLTTQNGDASVEFVSTVDSEEGQDSTLTVDSAETTFGDEVGEIEELGSLEVTGVANIDGGRITTTGLQRYRGAVTLGDDTTLAAGDEFATGVQFDDTVSSTANDAHTLAMEAATTFGGAVGAGADQELGSLNVDGLARIDGGSVETTGLQRYGGAVTLGQNTTLTTQNGDASVEFVSTVDSEEGQDSTLTVDSVETTFGDEVGEIEELGSLEVTGVANIDGGRITTTGLQRYGGAVTLGDDTTLAAGDTFATGIQFDDTVDSTANDAHTLALEAATTFGDAVGSGADQELGSLDVDGLAQIDGGSIETTGLQRYRGAVALGDDTMLTAGGQIRFDAIVDGDRHDLTVDAGDAIFRGDVVRIDEAMVIVVNDATFLGRIADTGDFTVVAGNDSMILGGIADTGAFSVEAGNNATFRGGIADTGAFTVAAGRHATFLGGIADTGAFTVAAGRDARFLGAIARTDAFTVAAGRHATFQEGIADTGDFVVEAGGDAAFGTGTITRTGAFSVDADGDATFRGEITETGDFTVVAGNDARFRGRIDGTGDLTVEAGNDARFDAAVTDTGDLTVEAGNDARFGAAVTDTGDFTVEAGNDARFKGRIDDTGALTVTAGTVEPGGDVMFLESIGKDTRVESLAVAAGEAGRIFLGSDDLDLVEVRSSGRQTYASDVTLRSNTSMRGGDDIRFEGSVDGDRHDLTVGAGNDATFEGRIDDTGALTVTAGEPDGDVMFLESIGEDARVESLAVAAGEAGRIFLGSDDLDLVEVRSSGSQTYASDVTLRSNTSMQGGDDIRFEGSVESTEDDEGNRRDLTIVGDDEVVIGGSADDKLVKVRDLEITGDTFVNAWRVRTTGDQTFHDRVTLGTTDGDQGVEFDGALVTFDDKIVGGGRDLTVDADGALFGGKVVGTGESAVIVVNDVKFLGRIDDTGAFTVEAGNDATFQGRIDDTGTFTVEAGNDATFQGRIDDTGAFTVAASNDVTFHKGIGERTKVESLAVTAGESGRITFEAKNHQIVASGDIVLNEIDPITHDGVHDEPGSEATIVSTGGGTFTITSKDGGEFRMGRNEKMSVEGNLTIKGSSPLETAYLSDINTLGDLEVNANEIVILLRGSGRAFAPGDPKEEARAQEDQGVDFVAGGRFIFGAVPTVFDDGGTFSLEPQFATPDGQGDANGNLAGFIMRSFGSSVQVFGAGGVGADSDLLATGASTTDPAEARAAAPTRETELADVRDQNPFPAGLDRELAEQLAILPRLLSPVEIAARLDGRYLYFDEWPTLVDPNAQDYHEVVIYRLGRQAVDALDTYQALRGRESQIRKRLGEAVFAYREEFGDDAALGEIGATWLAQEDYRDLVEDLQRLNLVLATIAEIGMTSSELERPRRVILENFRPKEEIESREELLEVLRTLPETPSGLDEAAPVPGGDAEAAG